MSTPPPPSPPGSPMPASALLDLYYLQIRSFLVEAAAGLDRIQNAPGGAEAVRDPRFQALRAAAATATREETGRVETILNDLSVD